MNAFVVSGLIKRRAELAGDIERAHEVLRKMVLDLENLDATILQFEPDFKVETIKPRHSGRQRIGVIAVKCPGSFSASFAKPQSRLPVATLHWNYWSSGPWTRMISGYYG